MLNNSHIHVYLLSAIIFLGCTQISPVYGLKSQKSEILHKAIIENNLTTLEQILTSKECDINAPNDIGETPLLYSIRQGNINATKMLLSHNAHINGPALDGISIIHYAADSGNPEIIKLLLAHGVNASVETTTKEKPIHYAARNGHLEIVKILAEQIPMPLHQQPETPLVLALSAFYGCNSIIEYYIQKGADLSIISDSQLYDFTLFNNKPSSLVYFACVNNHYQTVKKLLRAGAIATHKPHENAPLFAAIQNNNIRMIKRLLKHKADPNSCDDTKHTALHIAAKKSPRPIMRLLIHNNALLNAPNNLNQTPIDLALAHDNIPACEELIAHGADLICHTEPCYLPQKALEFMESIPEDIETKTLEQLFAEECKEFLIVRHLIQHPLNPDAKTCSQWFFKAISLNYHYAAHLIQQQCQEKIMHHINPHYHENSIAFVKHILAKENYYPHEIDIFANTQPEMIITKFSKPIETLKQQLQELKSEPLWLTPQASTFSLLKHIVQHESQETKTLLAPIFDAMQALPDIQSNSCKQTIYTRFFVLSCALSLKQKYEELISPIYQDIIHKLNGYITTLLFAQYQNHALLEKIVQLKKTLDAELSSFKIIVSKAYLLAFPMNNYENIHGITPFPGELDDSFFSNKHSMLINKALFDTKNPTILSDSFSQTILNYPSPQEILFTPITQIDDTSKVIDLGGATKNLFTTLYHCFFPKEENITPANAFFFSRAGSPLQSMPTIKPRHLRINNTTIPQAHMQQKKYTDAITLFGFFLKLGVAQARSPLTNMAKIYLSALDQSYRTSSFPWATLCSTFIEHDPLLITAITKNISQIMNDPACLDDILPYDEQALDKNDLDLIHHTETLLHDYTITKTEQNTVLDALNNGFFLYLNQKQNSQFQEKFFDFKVKTLTNFAQSIQNLTETSTPPLDDLMLSLIAPNIEPGEEFKNFQTMFFIDHIFSWLNAHDYAKMFKTTSKDTKETLDKQLIFTNSFQTDNTSINNLKMLFKQALYELLLEDKHVNANFKIFTTGTAHNTSPITIQFTKSGNNFSHTCSNSWDISLEELMLYKAPNETDIIKNMKNFIKDALGIHTFNAV